MSDSRKCFTFIWKIKNFSLCNSAIYSPVFVVHTMHETKWTLCISPFFNNDSFSCYIIRGFESVSSFNIPNSYPKQIVIDYELSFLTVDGSIIHSEKFLKKKIKEGCWDTGANLYGKNDEVFVQKKHLFIPDDNLTICCRMWDNQKLMNQSGRCFAETQIETECRSLVGTIEKFSYLEPMGKYPICIKSSSEKIRFSFMNVAITADGKLDIDFELEQFSVYICKIYIPDVFGNKMKSGKIESREGQSHSIRLAFPKELLMENQEYYLPNNILTIECEVIFSTGKETESIDEPEYGFDYAGIPEMISNVMKTKLPSNEYHLENLSTLKDDLNSLFKEGILCDTKLKTATGTFSVHRAVLCARSPVFKSMFTIDMREKMSNTVDIDDLDADTVHRMIKFMYLDTLDELEYESAKSLFFAADKYELLSLRYRCLNFLKQNILPTNCCDILLLADKHQDNYLKNAVQDYIIRNDEKILFSDEWKQLEKNHPNLAIEILRGLYIKNRRN